MTTLESRVFRACSWAAAPGRRGAAWFEAHRAKYDEPARYDFDEAALSGQASEADVRCSWCCSRTAS
ncbi:MAG: hypothetical protein ABJB12_15920 [Pseudomonadota bacterium]